MITYAVGGLLLDHMTPTETRHDKQALKQQTTT